MLRSLTLAVSLSLLSLVPAWAATYYVATNGDNSRSCSTATNINTPKQTFASAIPCMGAGDTLYARGGTYTETLRSSQIHFPVGANWGGGVATIASYPAETAIINGAIEVFPTNADSSAPGYIVFDRLVVDRGGSSSTTVVYDGALVFYTSHLRFSNGEVRNANGPMIYAAGMTDIQFINNNIHDSYINFDPNLWPQCGNQGCTVGGLCFYGHPNNSLFEGNTIHGCTGFALQFYCGDCGPVITGNTIRNNVFYNNGTGGDNLIANNVFYGGTGAKHLAAIQDQNSGDKIYNNTFYNMLKLGIYIYPGATDVLVTNNLIYTTGDQPILNVGTRTILATNLTGTNPLFVNAGGADFHLASNSPAIGYGTNLSSIFTTDIDGSARAASGPWDVGAYVSGVTVPQPAAQLGFATQPQNTAAGAVMPTMTVQLQNTLGALIPSASGTVTLSLAGVLVPRTGMTVVSVDSAETPTYAKEYAIDGDTTQFWHTQYAAAQPAHPHEIILNLGASYSVAGLTYRPRDDGQTSGNLAQYAVYVSTDGSTWGTAVKTGTLTSEVKTHGLTWTPKTGSYLRLVALSEIAGYPYTDVNELLVIAATTSTLSGTVSQASSSGTATFPGISIATPGVGYVLKATSAGLTEGLSTPFTITGSAPVATNVAFGTQPVSTQVSTTMPDVTVRIQDATNALVTAATNTVTIVELTTGVTVAGTLSRNAVNGVATFPGLSIATVGTGYQFRATATGLTAGNSTTFNITSGAPTPTKLGWGTQPASTDVNATMATITVLVQEANGATAGGATNTVTIVELTTGVTVAGTLSRAAVNGIATFPGLSIATPGVAYRFRATSPGLTQVDSATFTISTPAPAGTLYPARALHLVP
jgi:hypothetical protein